ncbi:zinc finger protein 235-like isoform X2 [Galleria mellonella]|nr:zinc finger protein 235-like isoform X2 [Galleria mellonella]XP_052748052.1 zinc finger protein 235-like isoform X2 [Galleria mellonella]
MSQPFRYVNVVPNIKIKKEVVEDDDEVIVHCRLCSKGFVSEMALRNHARMEHFESFATGDSKVWMRTPPSSPKRNASPDRFDPNIQIKKETEELLSTMEPGNLMSLASEDVSYIIIKAEDLPNLKATKKKDVKVMKVPKPVTTKKEKEPPQPITGPFECLQPSTLVADGTCHQIFFSCCEYSVHFRDEHTRRRKGHRCQVCEKPLLLCDEAIPYPCEVCGVGFQTNKELMDHMSIVHVKLKPFECTVCYKRFTQQSGVQQHMRMHTGDRPFPCTFCPKAFTQKSGLDQHLRIHTKVKPYRCVICNKAFCQSVHLKQHMRTHTNVSPFQCGICQKKFKQSSHLKYHLKNHNPSNMTEEQKHKYAELVGMIQKEVEMEVDPVEIQIEDMQGEQYVVAVQGVQNDFLEEASDGTWNVKMVNN